jgi:mRNA interferase RelE/StbE
VSEKRYRVEFDDDASKQLRKLDKLARSRVMLALVKLETDPRPDGVKKLTGYENRWRIRVGDWHVVYRIEDGLLVVIVVAVGHRSKVYKAK